MGIELGAIGVGVASVGELAGRLGSSGWPARSAGAGRDDSLDACLAWSHALLSSGAVVVFRRLSIFPAGFDLAAAQEVAGTSPVDAGRGGALVEQLVPASLLEPDTNGPRTPSRFNLPAPH